MNALPRRKKGLLMTIGIGGLAIAIAVTAWLVLRPAAETYVPGGAIEGLTRGLTRPVPADASRISFTDATLAAGIDFKHFSGDRTSQIPEDMGSGAAWGDYDNDGWQDLYVVNVVGPLTMSSEAVRNSPAHNVLYHNNGDGTFEDVSVASGLDIRHWGSAASWGDADNDGYIDLFVTSYGENLLFRNNRDGTFSDITDAAGVGGLSAFWAGASWADYDVDGWLDLYVTGYVQYDPSIQNVQSTRDNVEHPASINPLTFDPERNLLYRNNGDGTFSETALPAGVENSSGRSLEAAWADFDDDGWPDLYVANDVSDNVFYRNLGNGTFEDVSHRSLVADYRSAMGLAVADWDRDLDLDLFITHWLAQENALFSNQATPLRFRDIADKAGLGQQSLDFVGWGTGFFDYDNDGNPDLLVVNGSTLQEPADSTRLIPMTDLLYWNGGKERGFFDVSSIAGAHFQTTHVSRGAAFADYDNDGDVDVYVANHNGPGVLLSNAGHPTNHWVEVLLNGTVSTSRGVGAKIVVTAGDQKFLEVIGSQPSYLSQSSAVAHFGLGNRTSVDTIHVHWPSGSVSTMTNLPVDQIYTIDEGEVNK